MLYSIRMRAENEGRHICGAEGIYPETEIFKVQSLYLTRALDHPRGKAKTIILTIEELTETPKFIKSLPVRTCKSNARDTIITLLKLLNCSSHSIDNGLSIIYNNSGLRGAAIIDAQSGDRLDTDIQRGVRAVRFGLSEKADIILNDKIETFKLINTRIKEGLLIASKIASCPDVIAELCVPDNPDYTTGYVASKRFGYARIPNIKEYGMECGGRVIFTNSKGCNDIINYLEVTPVLIDEILDFSGEVEINEIASVINS